MSAYQQPVPRWLWRLANGLLGMAVLGVAALAFALARGLADPTRAGPLWLFDDFKGDTRRWSFTTAGDARLQTGQGALLAEFTSASAQAATFGLTDGPAGADFSFEVAGTPRDGANDLAYGLVFAWQDAAHYSAVLVNGNGYAEAYRLEGTQRIEWFKWQQWPHAFGGPNRVRVDVRGDHLLARVNDELLTEATLTTSSGKIGVLARGPGSGGIVFSWVKVWAPPSGGP